MRQYCYVIVWCCLVSVISCTKEKGTSKTSLQANSTCPPLSTVEYLRGRQAYPYRNNQTGQRSPQQCDFPREEISAFVDTLQAYLTQDYGSYQASYYCDTLRTHQEYSGFFVEAPVATITNNFPLNANKSIDWALEQQPRPLTRVDSAARIINYVFTQYSYGGGSINNPQSYLNASMNLIGDEISANRLAGVCGDLTHYLDIIICEKFPWWGTPVALSTQPIGTIGHTFAGLADAQGTVYMVLDPTVNVIWVNAQNEPLPLEEMQQLLVSEPEKVFELSSTVFGNKQKQFSESQCILHTDIVPGSAVAIFEPQTGFYAIQANWYGFNDTTSLNYRALIAPYWANRGLPGNTWANQCLIIDFVSCRDAHIEAIVLQRYSNYATQKGF